MQIRPLCAPEFPTGLQTREIWDAATPGTCIDLTQFRRIGVVYQYIVVAVLYTYHTIVICGNFNSHVALGVGVEIRSTIVQECTQHTGTHSKSNFYTWSVGVAWGVFVMIRASVSICACTYASICAQFEQHEQTLCDVIFRTATLA